jgi:uncharacterized protein YjbI with pentapeptide repeats
VGGGPDRAPRGVRRRKCAAGEAIEGTLGFGAAEAPAQPQGFSLLSADLREADLCYARLQGADLDHARLRRSQSTARANGGRLAMAGQSRGADLSFAGLQRAKLDHADFSGANLHKADLAGASLWGAQLSGACLGDAVGLRDDQLKNAHLA